MHYFVVSFLSHHSPPPKHQRNASKKASSTLITINSNDPPTPSISYFLSNGTTITKRSIILHTTFNTLNNQYSFTFIIHIPLVHAVVIFHINIIKKTANDDDNKNKNNNIIIIIIIINNDVELYSYSCNTC